MNNRSILAQAWRIIGGLVTGLALFGGGMAAHAQAPTPFRVYLTFEDGPTDAYTPGILDALQQYNAKASFLIEGYQIAGHEAILQRELREGHALVNHLWEEPPVYAGTPDDIVIDSYLRTEAALRAALGDMLPVYDAQVKMFWQPGGGTQPLPPIDGVHVITYNWNVNSDDCGWGLPSDIDLDTEAFDAAVIDNVLNESHEIDDFYSPYNVYDFGDGVIIAFHDINRVTGRVLPIILTELQSAGATFEALPRPWDTVDSMPVVIGTPPVEGAGVHGAQMPGLVLTDARVRATPGLDGEIVGWLPVDAELTVIGRAEGWIQVEFNGGTGWVSRDLLKIFGPIPNLPLVA